MKKYVCPNKNEWTKAEDWLPFAQMVSVKFEDVPFAMKGISSLNSVMVMPLKKVKGRLHVGIMKEKRPLFQEGWLAAFPAGKIEDNQSPEEAAIKVNTKITKKGKIIFTNFEKIVSRRIVKVFHFT